MNLFKNNTKRKRGVARKQKSKLKPLRQLLYKPLTNSSLIISKYSFNEADSVVDEEVEYSFNEADSVVDEEVDIKDDFKLIINTYCDYLGSTLGGTFPLDQIKTKKNRILKLFDWCIVTNDTYNNDIYNNIRCLFTDQGLTIGKYLEHNTRVSFHTPATSLIWIDDIKSFLDYISTRSKGDPLLIREDDLRIVKTLLTKLSKAYRKLVRKQRSHKTLKSHIKQRKIPPGGLSILRTTVINQVAKVKA